ncbi:MAG: glutamate--cysteine ligase [Alphaproteobacteria bacterium]|jgi:glutamate--cysteine ligase|nr:glutamate--cysteine ligase [Alphaproteobacteria bacterium]
MTVECCDPPETDSDPRITSKRQLVEYLESGCKPQELWRIGTEHEKFVFRLDDLRPAPYDGPRGIKALLEGLRRYGWRPHFEGENLIALEDGHGGSITLEPGGQVELSGAPLKTIHQTCDETQEHLRELRQVNQELGLGMIGLGFQPKWPREAIPWMPKHRYRIMKQYMPTVGRLGLDMMTRTCTVQVNLDFESEPCMVQKFRVGLALQPIATALFANSPFTEGRPNGYQSYRSFIWTETDPDRCGELPFVFEDGFGFERYVDYVLDVPMYLVIRDGRLIDAAGQSFRDFLKGELPALPRELPTLSDWETHLTTVFPEVRLKRYLEMRGADGGPWRRLCALPALWVGLLYDDDASTAAWDLVKDWTQEERTALRAQVPMLGLRTPFRNRTVREVALEVLDIARAGLERRARRDGFGETEAHFLNALIDIAESGESPADRKLKKYHGEWQGEIDPIFREFAY